MLLDQFTDTAQRGSAHLAFDLRDDGMGEDIDGEIVISAETARRQAAHLGLDEGEELLRYAIHGALHLMGYDDSTPAGLRSMRQAEDRVLASLEDSPRQSRLQHEHRRTNGGV